MVQVKEKILILDDDPGILTAAKMVLKKEFPATVVSVDPHKYLESFRAGEFDLLILDMNFTPGSKSGEEGLELIKLFLGKDPDIFIIVMTAYGDIDLAVKAMQAGASDFITKPWDNRRLQTSVRNAMKLRMSGREIQLLQDQKTVLMHDIERQFEGFIGESAAMKDVFQIIKKVAPSDANILILGENGTGKELIARAIHRISSRDKGVFVNVDLGTINESLFESELFGHKKGAFTDARQDRTGRFETADRGTLFLDEIGNLPITLQQKLLSAIQNRSIIPVGSSHEVPVDIRLISATNRDIHGMVEEGSFREDLLYRINTVEITLPPLRHRTEDIRPLTEYFLGIYTQKYHRPVQGVSASAYQKLSEYGWPGNVRELMHMVERAVILSDMDMLSPADFPLTPKLTVATGSRKMDDIEKIAILEALKSCRYNISRAAYTLGLGRSTLYRKMKKYDIPFLQG